MTGRGDLKNIQNRQDRKDRHNERAHQELDQFFQLYAKKIEVISYNPLDLNKEYGEYLIMIRLKEGMKPRDFLKFLIDKIGEEI